MRKAGVVVVLAIAGLLPAASAHAAVELHLPRTILFSRTDGTGTHVYAVEPDGTALTQLTSGAADDVDPAWTADASAITFTRKTATGADTWIMGPDGSDPQLFLVNARSLVWDYYGDAVAFVRSRNGNLDIWTAAADGSDKVRLTTDIRPDVQPAWTFDGRVSFVSDRSGRERVYAMDLDGTDLVRLTSGPGEQRHPSWYGDELVYEQDDGNDRDIVRLRVPTGTLHVEVGGRADDRDPDVAPDGELVFRRVRADGSSSLVHGWLTVSGSATVMTQGAGDRAPAWAPAFAWERAQDDQAKGNLLEAAATAQAIRDETGSFDDADPLGMTSANPSLDYVGGTVDSTGPEELSLKPDGTRWSAAALSYSGTCYYLRLDDIVGTTYGLEFGASGASMCSGTDASGAQGAEW